MGPFVCCEENKEMNMASVVVFKTFFSSQLKNVAIVIVTGKPLQLSIK